MKRNDPRIRVDPAPAGSTPPAFPVLRFASRVPGRSPEWKQHTELGQARSAIVLSGPRYDVSGAGEIWELLGDGSWSLRDDIAAGTLRSDLPW